MPHIDLHIHSNRSDDGEFSPAELVAMAEAAGLAVMAIADHNSSAGVDEAVRAAAGRGIRVVPAIEMDCRYGKLSLHVLGYGIDHLDPRYAALAENIHAQEKAGSARRMELVRGLGIRFDEARVWEKAPNGVVTAELLAEVALADPANDDNALLAPYRLGGPRSDNPWVNFYWDYCAPGKPAHVSMDFPSLDETVALIRNTGGVAVLAHPGILLKGCEEVLRELAGRGVAGVEAFSSYHSPEACAFWRGLAGECGMFVTCGSDFHGRTKPAIRLGGHGGSDADEESAMKELP